jgi:hypothetical protein
MCNVADNYCRNVIIRSITLTLLTETCVNAEEYCGKSEVLFSLISVVCNCHTHTKNTDGNGYGQPHAVAERCDVAIPCHVRVVG